MRLQINKLGLDYLEINKLPKLPSKFFDLYYNYHKDRDNLYSPILCNVSVHANEEFIAFCCPNCSCEIFALWKTRTYFFPNISSAMRDDYYDGFFWNPLDKWNSDPEAAKKKAKEIQRELESMASAHIKESERTWGHDNTVKKEIRGFKENYNTCPVCGAKLVKSEGYFDASWLRLEYGKFSTTMNNTTEDLMKLNRKTTGSFYDLPLDIKARNEANLDNIFNSMKEKREKAENVSGNLKKETETFINTCNTPVVVENSAVKAERVKSSVDNLKKYIQQLIKLETDIFSLSGWLEKLYYREYINNKQLIQESHCEPTTPEIDEEIKKAEKEIEKLKLASYNAKRAIPTMPPIKYPAKPCQPQEPREPEKPQEPILATPGFFNKKKVLAANQFLIEKHKREIEKYEEKYEEYKKACDEYEKACEKHKTDLLLYEKKVALAKENAEKDFQNQQEQIRQSQKEAEQQIEKATTALNSLIAEKDAQLEYLKTAPTPGQIAKNLLDDDISKCKSLLKDTIECRNKLYSLDVVFSKYRNSVALSTFYEYLMSGRCETLEGTGGAYNIYESECRANIIISQLSDVVASLEEIKNSQYMIYSELKTANSHLSELSYTMGKALDSINDIKSNTKDMKSQLEHISENSDVIAHNTAVTAYYSKKTAELTDAMGYLIALS